MSNLLAGPFFVRFDAKPGLHYLCSNVTGRERTIAALLGKPEEIQAVGRLLSQAPRMLRVLEQMTNPERTIPMETLRMEACTIVREVRK